MQRSDYNLREGAKSSAMSRITKQRDQGTAWIWDKLDRHLAARNLKQTKQRRTIVEAFVDLATHVSAEELHDQIRALGHNIGLATIYRTLNLLKEAGIVDQKQFADGRSVFEVDFPDHHHDHLICLDCGTVIEFENDAIEKLQEKVAKSHKFRLTSHSLELFGHCLRKNCEIRQRGTKNIRLPAEG